MVEMSEVVLLWGARCADANPGEIPAPDCVAREEE